MRANIITFLFITAIFSLFSQSRLDYDHDTRFFLGINGGVTWHNTDVRTKTEWGWGATLGRAFNYEQGRAVSFDFRGRYLYGEWLGQNNIKTDTNYVNIALSSGNTNYKDSLNYYVLNFKNKLHSVDLELVLHANSLHERTNWDLFLFGGIGITAFKTRGDLLDKNKKLYNYKSLKDLNDGSLSSLMDKNYETYLDGTGKTVKYYLMPSIGLGLGYQLTRNISIGFEHRMTFSRVDHFDGYNNPKGYNNRFIKRKNDIFYYSSLYLKFQIHHNRFVDEKKDDIITKDPIESQKIPEIQFTNPALSGTSVNQQTFSLKANILNIENRENINFKHNGVYVESFSYNNTSKKFESNLLLQPGQNNFEIIATNPYGYDQKNTIVIFKEAQSAPPMVEFVNPTTNPFNTNQSNVRVQASVLNVVQQNQISIQVNGTNLSQFSYNNLTNIISFSTNLSVGNNVITIQASNSSGSDVKSITLIYNPVIIEALPVVYFTDPSRNPYNTNQNAFSLDAVVQNVSTKENIIFKQNGNINQNYMYNSYSNHFESNVILNPGQNIFEIIASNSSGVSQASTIIVYEVQAPKPPVITFINPTVNPYQAENLWFPLQVNIYNIENSNQIQLFVNGNNINNFIFNNQTKVLSSNISLNEGQNIVSVTATNNDGTDSKQSIIIFRRANQVFPPNVNFLNPASNPFTSNQANIKITASVQNVQNNTGINILCNNQNITNFQFNASNQELMFSTFLLEGANTITVTGTNEAGTDSKTLNLIYKKTEQVFPPNIVFIDPNQNPMTVFSQSYQLSAKVSGVKLKQDIQVLVNGSSITWFDYNPSTEIVSFSSSLMLGSNIFEIIATNNGGTDRKSTTLIYREAESLAPPVVNIYNPLANPFTSYVSTQLIEAIILNIVNPQQIQVQVNGKTITNYQFDNIKKSLQFTMNLIEGSNTLQISASNAAGSHSDSKTIIFQKENKIPIPIISFIQPSQNGKSVQLSNYTMKATILHIENTSQISLTHNGNLINPQFYTFNSSTKELKYTCNLTLGNNIFTISAVNISGTASSTANIIYKKEEKPCNPPVLSFIYPVKNNTDVTSEKITVKYKADYVESKNQLEFFHNGKIVPIQFNISSKTGEAVLNLSPGLNSIEIIAKTSCGENKLSQVVSLKPVNIPCANVPSFQLIQPITKEIVTDKLNAEIRLGLINIINNNDIQLKINGINQSFQFDQATKIVFANISLKEGLNRIECFANNECGSSKFEIKITRISCNKPEINIIQTSVPNRAETNMDQIQLNAGISNIDNKNDIEIIRNGKAVNFTFMSITKTISLQSPIDLGLNTFIIKAKNSCGENSETFEISRKKEIKVGLPTIQITNPNSNPFSTSSQSINLQAITQNITSAQQISLTVNGRPVNPQFNSSNGSVTYNLNLNEGNNNIVLTVSNEAGSASDTRTIKYSKANLEQRPEIILLNPNSCPMNVPKGIFTVRGYAKNIQQVNQLVVKVNGKSLTNVNPISSIDKLNFQFDINVPLGMTSLEISASNTAGSDSKICYLKAEDNLKGDCLPTVSATFSADDKTVNVSSTKDLSNVVIKYHDQSVQKFDNLSGLSKSFTASGLYAGKCIVGVWIKSGCNQSNDGPGYGEFVKNSKVKTACFNDGGGNSTNCKPNVKAIFSSDSKSVNVSSSKDLINVVLKYFDGSVQKFENLSGKSKDFKGNGNNNGKCIVGVWIRSGCNFSSDGPGYGEFVNNPSVSTSCANANTDCKPKVSAMFSPDSKSVTVNSDKELINVVLKYHDGQEQKFDNLKGFTKEFKGNGINNDKCIVGVWVKSGCNESNAGQNYGEWIVNPQKIISCGSTDSKRGSNLIEINKPGKGGR